MKLGFTSWNYEQEISSGQMNALTVAEEAARLGFDAIEFMGYHLPGVEQDALATFRRQVEALGLTISAIDARNMCFGDGWSAYRNDVCMIQFWIQAAAILGAPTVSIFLGKFPDEEARPSQHQRNIEGLRACLPCAKKHNVRIGIENHLVYAMGEELACKHEVPDMLELIATLDSPLVGTTPDSDNCFCDNFGKLTSEQQAKVYEDFSSMMKFAKHVHLKVKGFDANHNTLQPDMDKLVEIITRHEYDGHLSFEFMKPVEGANDKVLKECLVLLRESLQKIEALA